MTEHPDAAKPIREMTCTCCGVATRGRQWWNQDKGFTLCARCVELATRGGITEDVLETYGVLGVHYGIA